MAPSWQDDAAGEEEEEDDDYDVSEFQSLKDHIIFLIDASPSMFQKRKDGQVRACLVALFLDLETSPLEDYIA